MNRVIKFRVWGKHTDGTMAMVDDVILGAATLNSLREDDGDVLMQFTGSHDKNGKEIYEGDILRKFNQEIAVVKFGEYCFTGGEYTTQGLGFYLYSEPKGMFGVYDFPTKSETVIGNIYENPALLDRATDI